MVAYNAHEADDTGIIWCTVLENEAGYRPMTGNGPLAAPWYLAHWDHFDTRLEAIEAAGQLAAKWNEEQGYSERDVMDIVASSMRAQAASA